MKDIMTKLLAESVNKPYRKAFLFPFVLPVAGVYSFPYNYMDLPVGIVPITQENQDDQAKLADYNYSDFLCKLVKKVKDWTHPSD